MSGTLREELKRRADNVRKRVLLSDEHISADEINGALADAALATFRTWLAENGMVVVPKLPSEDQFRAGSTFRFTVETHGYKDTAGIYEAMIAAAPDSGLE